MKKKNPAAEKRIQQSERLRRELLHLAALKYDQYRSEEDTLFWEILKFEIELHAEAKESNKKAYFTENERLIGLGSLLKSGEKNKAWLGYVFTLVLLLAGTVFSSQLIAKLEIFSGPEDNGEWLSKAVTGICAVGLVAITYRFQSKCSQLKLWRYGETWIRHSLALSELEQELMRFVYGSPPYDKGTLAEQRRQLQDRILAVREKNHQRFETNMKELEEYIE